MGMKRKHNYDEIVLLYNQGKTNKEIEELLEIHNCSYILKQLEKEGKIKREANSKNKRYKINFCPFGWYTIGGWLTDLDVKFTLNFGYFPEGLIFSVKGKLKKVSKGPFVAGKQTQVLKDAKK